MTGSLNADILVKLTLTRKPEQRPKRDSGTYTLAKGREGTGEGVRFWSLFVYNEAARAEIDRLDAGDVVSVQGAFDAQIWEGRLSLKISVNHAVALRPPPRVRKPRATGREVASKSWAAPSKPREEAPLDNPLPF